MINKGEKTNFKEYNSALKKLEILKKIRLETSKFDFIVVPSTFSRAQKLTKQRLKTPVLFGRQWDTHV